MILKHIISLIRIKHWIKNSFVFLPMFFSASINLFVQNFYLFFSFCLVSSSIYVLNDIIDVKEDRKHPEKRKRPIANKLISTRTAWITFTILLIMFIFSLFFIEKSRSYILIYFMLNIGYIFFLKNFSIIDVSCIALGFVLRTVAGAKESQIFISHWMILLVFLLSVSLAFAKRRYDLFIILNRESLHKSNEKYTTDFLDMALTISFSVTLVAYILYSVSEESIRRIGSNNLYITSLFVFVGIMRYIEITLANKKSGSPVEVILKDRFILLNLICWIISFFIIIHEKNL